MRLTNYDYNKPGFYFVTICTKDRKCYFGNIIGTRNLLSLPQLELSEVGKIAKKCWLEIPKHFPDAKLDEFTIMPNHFHGIIDIIDSRIVENRYTCFLQCVNQ